MKFIKFKNAFVMGGIAAAMLTISIGAQAASESATINISANVVANTCTPDWTAAGKDVNMNRVSVDDFGSDKIGATQQFTLNLTECGAGTTKVKVTASGIADTTDSTLFSNTLAEGASGVGVGVWGGPTQATQLNPAGNNSVEYAVSNNAVNMTFLTKLMKTGTEAVTAGNLKSIVTLTVDYE